MPEPEFARFETGTMEYRAVKLSLKTGIFWKWWREDERAILTAEHLYAQGLVGGLLGAAQITDEDDADT